MDKKKKQAIMASDTLDDLLNAEYGERGTESRETFEAEADAFCLAECLKEQRRLAGLPPVSRAPLGRMVEDVADARLPTCHSRPRRRTVGRPSGAVE